MGLSFKKTTLIVLAIFSIGLTGCLEEILASLCNRLASNNSIIAVYSTSADYSNSYAKVTYRNVTTSAELELSECDGSFSFPNGERKTVTGSGSADSISFVAILNEQNESFFMTNGVPNESDSFEITVSWFSGSCPSQGGSSGSPFEEHSSTPASLAFESPIGSELPPLIDECSITGETAIVNL